MRSSPASSTPSAERSEAVMNDIAMVLLTLAFFGLAWRYVRALERL
jgi:hypothetical protein